MKMIWLVVAVAIGFSSIVASAPPPSPVIEAAAATQAVGTPVIGGPSVVAAFPMADPSPVIRDLPLPSDYCSTAVYHHNIHRLNHSAPLVTYDASVATYASTNILGCPATIVEGGGSNWYGYWSGSDVVTLNNAQALVDAIESWNNEEPLYASITNDYTIAPDLNNDFDSWGHFTQMVWNAETTIGCWSVFCDADSPFIAAAVANGGSYTWGYQVVCASNPAGNLLPAANWATSVAPPLGQAPDDYTIWNNNGC